MKLKKFMIFLVVKNVKPCRAVNPGRKEIIMEQIYSLVKLFGERYIFCDNDQALIDALPENRDELVSAYAAIMDYIRTKDGE